MENISPEELAKNEIMRGRAEDALVGITNAWERVEDIHGLPLSVDDSYKAIREQLNQFALVYGEALFYIARSTHGEERLRYATGLDHMLDIIEQEKRTETLSGLMTTRGAVKELIRKAREEVKESKKRTTLSLKSLLARFKK